MNNFKLIGVLVLSMLLAACDSFTSKPDLPDAPAKSWEQHQGEVKQIQNWEISGKIGIRTPQDSNSASLKWLQEQQTYQIDIRGPLGQGGASIQGQPNHVVVDIPGEGTFSGSSPEYILFTQLGWDIPISDIYWWVRGVPAPNKPYQQTLENNRLNTLQQGGWSIEYLRYNTLSPALPRKVRLKHNDIQITMVLSSWIVR